jgi:photosystem II stability/assembly factor-like uncharacterized protein
MFDRLLVSTRKGLFTVERSGPRRWAITGASFLADNVQLTLPDPRDGAWYASLHHGHFGSKVQRSRDGGKTWQEVGVPAYPPKPADDDQKDFWGKPLEWKLDRIWALEPGNKDQAGRIWAGTLPGGLFRSDNHGDTWELVGSLWNDPKRKEWFGGGADLPGIHSVCVDPRDGKRVSVGVSCGGVWQTTDDGETWNCRSEGMYAEYMPPEKRNDPNKQDPHRVVFCQAKPECMWAQHHNGIFRTTDGCASWSDVPAAKPSIFGFAVAVHPTEPDTAWFVPAIKDEKRIPVEGKVVVSRTRDGGKTFDVLRNGLPQEHAYDIVFRHAMDIDAGGNRLAFGSTTGSLWVTEDQGDSWQTISEHLPPVYGVRFVQ